MQAPIVASREPDATDAEVQKGTEQSNELSAIVNNFILRRTNALLSAHLPPKVLSVCGPLKISKGIIDSENAIMAGNPSMSRMTVLTGRAEQ